MHRHCRRDSSLRCTASFSPPPCSLSLSSINSLFQLHTFFLESYLAPPPTECQSQHKHSADALFFLSTFIIAIQPVSYLQPGPVIHFSDSGNTNTPQQLMQVPVVARHKNQHTTTSLVSFRWTQDRHLSLSPSHKAIQAGRILSDGDESHSDEMIGQSPTCQDRHTGTVPSACDMGAAQLWLQWKNTLSCTLRLIPLVSSSLTFKMSFVLICFSDVFFLCNPQIV